MQGFRIVCATIALCGLGACAKAPTPATPQPSAEAAPAAKATIGIDTSGLDRAVKPGDDFDEYANGGWRDRRESPRSCASRHWRIHRNRRPA